MHSYCVLSIYTLILSVSALSAYQKYKKLSPTHWKDAPFLYGYGLVLYHFNAYKW